MCDGFDAGACGERFRRGRGAGTRRRAGVCRDSRNQQRTNSSWSKRRIAAATTTPLLFSRQGACAETQNQTLSPHSCCRRRRAARVCLDAARRAQCHCASLPFLSAHQESADNRSRSLIVCWLSRAPRAFEPASSLSRRQQRTTTKQQQQQARSSTSRDAEQQHGPHCGCVPIVDEWMLRLCLRPEIWMECRSWSRHLVLIARASAHACNAVWDAVFCAACRPASDRAISIPTKSFDRQQGCGLQRSLCG